MKNMDEEETRELTLRGSVVMAISKVFRFCETKKIGCESLRYSARAIDNIITITFSRARRVQDHIAPREGSRVFQPRLNEVCCGCYIGRIGEECRREEDVVCTQCRRGV